MGRPNREDVINRNWTEAQALTFSVNELNHRLRNVLSFGQINIDIQVPLWYMTWHTKTGFTSPQWAGLLDLWEIPLNYVSSELWWKWEERCFRARRFSIFPFLSPVDLLPFAWWKFFGLLLLLFPLLSPTNLFNVCVWSFRGLCASDAFCARGVSAQ